MRSGNTTRITIVLASLIFSVPVSSQTEVEASIEWVRALEDDCIRDHGYVCVQTEEDDFLSMESHHRMLPGTYLDAWTAARADFLAIEDLTEEQKSLSHYKIGFTHGDEHIIVLFQALLLPQLVDGVPSGTMRVTFGRSTKYWVDRETMRITKRLYLR